VLFLILHFPQRFVGFYYVFRGGGSGGAVAMERNDTKANPGRRRSGAVDDDRRADSLLFGQAVGGGLPYRRRAGWGKSVIVRISGRKWASNKRTTGPERDGRALARTGRGRCRFNACCLVPYFLSFFRCAFCFVFISSLFGFWDFFGGKEAGEAAFNLGW
jgi:hypothetical protein